jgi:hypothetical protein
VSIYLPGDVIEECRDLLRQGQRLETLAGRLRIAPQQLQVLLDNGQTMRRIPDAAEVDLWRDADAVL